MTEHGGPGFFSAMGPPIETKIPPAETQGGLTKRVDAFGRTGQTVKPRLE